MEQIIKNIFGITANDFSILSAIVTLLALIFAYWQWIKIKIWNRKAAVNSVFEEIRHNLNVREHIFYSSISKDDWKFFYGFLKNTNHNSYYPNPTDSNEIKEKLLSIYDNKLNDDIPKTLFF